MGQKRWWVVAAVVLAQVFVLGSFVAMGTPTQPRAAPVAVVADPVVVASVADQLAAVSPGAVELRTAPSPAAARADVSAGRLVAAVLVDLRVEQDTVLLASANGDDLNRAVLQLARAVGASSGRDVVVEDVVPTRDGDDDARGIHVLVGTCVLLGFVAPIVITWLRGPVARTWRRGAVRLAIVAGSAVTVGFVIALVAAPRYDGGLLDWWLLAALTLSSSATVTLALEGLFGAAGIGVATALLVLSAAPMARLVSPWMLSEPWSSITPWLPHGAALEVGRAQAYFGGPDLRALLVLVVWNAWAVLTLVISRRERDRGSTEVASTVLT